MVAGTQAGFPRRFAPAEGWHKSYPPPPASWVHAETEWAVWYVLTVKMKYRLNMDFLYQHRIPLAGLNKVSPDFRSDFILLPYGKNGNPAGYRYPRSITIDPISAFTHRSKALDILKRTLLAGAGYLCVFIDDYALVRAAEYYVRRAAAGVDLSSRRSF